jgi:thiosulfate/3-mercaptopyruvate sulfurtransferase
MAFRTGRIPTSQNIDWQDWAQERGDLFGLTFGKASKAGVSRQPDEKLQNELRKLGLSNDQTIVIVGEGGGWGEEGRIAWNLLYWGAKNVALLNGGYAAWEKISQQKPERGEIVKPSYGNFTITVQPERRTDIDAVKTVMSDKSRSLIDNRSKEEFQGKKLPGQKRGGHIPGALSVPIETLFNSDGGYIDKTAFEKYVQELGIRNPIAYGVGGVRSALFAMLWEANFKEIVPNYEGSIWEWSARSELPLE